MLLNQTLGVMVSTTDFGSVSSSSNLEESTKFKCYGYSKSV